MKKFLILSFVLLLIPAFSFPAQDSAKNDNQPDNQELTIQTNNQNLKLLVLKDNSWLIMKNNVVVCPEWLNGGIAVTGSPDTENEGTTYRINTIYVHGRNLSLDVVNSDEEEKELKASTSQQTAAFTCYLNFETNRSRCLRTEGDMRTIAAAINIYFADNGQYPDSGFKNLLTALEDNYIASMPRVDGWGNPLIYEIGSGNGISDQSFRLISYGKDGKPGPTPPDGSIPPNDKDFFNYDILIKSGGITCKCCLFKLELLENDPRP